MSRTALYRHFDKHNVLLYVGISVDAMARLSQHSITAPWFEQTHHSTYEWLETRREAEAAEHRAIANETRSTTSCCDPRAVSFSMSR